MKPLYRLLATLALPLFTLPGPGTAHAELPPVDIGARFREARLEGSFVLLDGQSGEYRRYNAARAARRFQPASTYKIPNTLIALETGVASGKDFKLAWDSRRAPRKAWWPATWAQDQTLESALKYSAVWYYQELARRIGAERMQAYVDRFDYGNRNISGGIDRFWLTGGLEISADEQVAFLRRFHRGLLGVSQRTTQLAKDMLVLEDAPAYRLSGKTGWVVPDEPGQPQTGWLVGYVERQDDVFFFALNIEIKRNEDAAARIGVAKAVLRDFGLLQDDGAR